MNFRPSHRNPNDLQPEVCDLCGAKVGRAHLIEPDVEGLRGYAVCDLHRFERVARVTPSLNDYKRINPPLPVPDEARLPPFGDDAWWIDPEL